MSKIQDLLPEFIAEIESSLTSMGYSDLASQLPDLEFEKWTYDPESEAGYLYLSGQYAINLVEQNIIGVRHGESIELETANGIIVIDTDNFNRIKDIEIISRKDLVEILERISHFGKGIQAEATEPHW